ncbi:MAG TPA: SOS response-associated peptidase [Blastocatellia bacterium]|jgi:putative SOS response-associated peptidase YedK|nr:SOS response-associated peptidase [Blastocatellia bacterium]
MCGRFVRKRSASSIAADLGVEEVVDDLPPSFNIAPTHDVAVIVNNGATRLVAMRWGLVPAWATDPGIGSKLINARAETLAEKGAFKEALKRRRCLVVADGFYEWQKAGREKRPLLIRLKSDQPFAFAGLYEIWTPPWGETLTTCTIITTEPNELMRPIHDRMPAILPRKLESLWLDETARDPHWLLDMLAPYPAEQMEAYPVSSLVNSVKNDSPACIEPVEVEQPRLLF